MFPMKTVLGAVVFLLGSGFAQGETVIPWFTGGDITEEVIVRQCDIVTFDWTSSQTKQVVRILLNEARYNGCKMGKSIKLVGPSSFSSYVYPTENLGQVYLSSNKRRCLEGVKTKLTVVRPYDDNFNQKCTGESTRRLRDASLEECLLLCDKTAGCLAASYREANGVCRLSTNDLDPPELLPGVNENWSCHFPLEPYAPGQCPLDVDPEVIKALPSPSSETVTTTSTGAVVDVSSKAYDHLTGLPVGMQVLLEEVGVSFFTEFFGLSASRRLEDPEEISPDVLGDWMNLDQEDVPEDVMEGEAEDTNEHTLNAADLLRRLSTHSPAPSAMPSVTPECVCGWINSIEETTLRAQGPEPDGSGIGVVFRIQGEGAYHAAVADVPGPATCTRAEVIANWRADGETSLKTNFICLTDTEVPAKCTNECEVKVEVDAAYTSQIGGISENLFDCVGVDGVEKQNVIAADEVLLERFWKGKNRIEMDKYIQLNLGDNANNVPRIEYGQHEEFGPISNASDPLVTVGFQLFELKENSASVVELMAVALERPIKSFLDDAGFEVKMQGKSTARVRARGRVVGTSFSQVNALYIGVKGTSGACEMDNNFGVAHGVAGDDFDLAVADLTAFLED